MSDPAAAADVVETALLGGKLRLRQLVAGHRAGTDAVLLAACIGEASGTLVDLGAGAGAAGLAVALRNRALRLILLEREPELGAVACENIALNGLEGRARVVVADALVASARAAAGAGDHSADVLITNPPYHAAAASRLSPDPLKARAHTFGADAGSALDAGLERWVRACAALVRPGGVFALIHRADALAPVLTACARRFGALALMPVHPKAGRPATRILIRGVAGSRGPLRILPGLTLHEPDGRFTEAAAAVHEGRTVLPF